MDMFTKGEAFSFIKNKLGVKDAEERMESDRRALLDNIILATQEIIPFQNCRLLSIPFQERRRPTLEEAKYDFVNGIGGLCFNMNICVYYLLKAIGFDVGLAHATCSTRIRFKNNHVVIYANGVEKPGDRFLVEVAIGFPTFQAVNLDFETESPIFISSYLEYKFVKYDGKLLRMHRKGDQLADPTRPRDPEVDFWLGDFRRMCECDIECTPNLDEFEECNEFILTNPKASPFHTSHRFVIHSGRKSNMIVNGKALFDNGQGVIETKEIPGGDEGIVAAIKNMCPSFPEDLVHKSLHNWRQTLAAAGSQ